MKIVTYTGKQQANFYIQSKGTNAGRPLRAPLRNSFAVFTDDEFLFQKVQALFIGRYFEPFIHGSVIPTICLSDVKEVIERTPIRTDGRVLKLLKSLNDIERLILLTQDKLKLLKEIKTATAREVIGK